MQRLLLATLVLCLGFVPVPRAQKSPCEWEGVERIVAMGDVHGAYEQILPVLKDAGIVDQKLNWAGGKTHFVQVGDVVDRGPDSRKVLDLYRKLEPQAARAGGGFHYLMGNHEAMRLTGDYRYTHAGEYAAFANSRSEETKSGYVANADPALASMIAGLPLGAVELMLEYGSNGTYGRILRRLDAVIKINNIIFVHGGLSPLTASMSCSAMNDAIRKELTSDLQKTRSAPDKSLAFGSDGPLWYRGLVLGEPDTIGPELDAMLQAQKATRIVVAHTAQLSGRFDIRYGGKVLVIDTGFQPEHVPTGHASALEIRGNVFTAIYPDKREVVIQAPAPSASTP